MKSYELYLFLGLISALLAAFFLLVYFTDSKNTQKIIAIGTCLAAIGTVGAFLLIMYQSNRIRDGIEYQIKSYNLDNRPFLHLEAEYFVGKGRDFEKNGIWYGGARFTFKNPGKIPASEIKVTPKINSNENRNIDLAGYMKKITGKDPTFRTVFPGEERIERWTPQIGKKPKLMHIWILVEYKGINPDKNYWFLLDNLYFIQELIPGKNATRNYKVWTETDWDKNGDLKPPEYIEPDWESQIKRMEESGLP